MTTPLSIGQRVRVIDSNVWMFTQSWTTTEALVIKTIPSTPGYDPLYEVQRPDGKTALFWRSELETLDAP